MIGLLLLLFGLATEEDPFGWISAPDAAQLRAYHELLCSEPHVAGTPADARTVARIEAAFEAMGLVVERQELELMLCRPLAAEVQIVAAADETSTLPLDLELRERAFPREDPSTAHPDIRDAWNAYSASGDVTAEVVYANYGRKEDFERLAELGVDVAGRIVVARYGGNFRGYKVHFAALRGAVGVLLYSDPLDLRYRPEAAYPQGGGANGSYIQRGSVLTLPYPGDPLTPLVEARPDAERLAMEEVDWPRIPCQPLGFAAAAEILRRMQGREVPGRWQGGLPLRYCLEGGPELRVRVRVEQERFLARTANVLATLAGHEEPEKQVILGCHFDAWTFGAGDPEAGTIVLLETARTLAEAARAGFRPARSIVFAAWAAEEFGILGSTEYCEAHADELRDHAVAYINLDMAAMGPHFRASGDPLLEDAIARAARSVPVSIGDVGTTDTWGHRDDAGAFPLGSLGGGSDHVGFYCHLGIPSCSLAAHGAEGVSYHSNYETLAWYRKTVGEDYGSALQLTRLLNVLTVQLASAPLLPFAPARLGAAFVEHLAERKQQAERAGLAWPEGPLPAEALRIAARGEAVLAAARGALAEGQLQRSQVVAVNAQLQLWSRLWLRDEGLPERPWYRSTYAATDMHSGYAAWILPLLCYAVQERDAELLGRSLATYREVWRELDESCERMERTLRRAPGDGD